MVCNHERSGRKTVSGEPCQASQQWNWGWRLSGSGWLKSEMGSPHNETRRDGNRVDKSINWYQVMNRPSHKELQGKLREARTAVGRGTVFLIDQETIAEDAIELGYDIGTELFEVLTDLLEAVPVGAYAGSRPPQKSYKDDIHGLDLFPFVLQSSRFGCRVYLKFALANASLWLVSLHKDRPPEETV